MKKILSFVLIALIALSTLISCSSSVKTMNGVVDQMYDVKAESSVGTSFNSTADGSFAEPESPMEEAVVDKGVVEEADTSSLENRKIIYSSNYSIETKEFDESISRLDALCKKYNAWYQSSSTFGTRENGNRNSHFSIRVPVENYRAFTESQSSVGTVVSSSENNRDVTEQYIDTEARLESALLREERVLKILENAGSLDDVLALERELSDIRYEIESLTGSLRKLDSLVDFSTVDVSVREVAVYTPKEPVVLTFSERLAKSFKSGISNFVDFLIDLALFVSYNLIGLVFWALVIIVVIIILIKKGKKKKIKKEELPKEVNNK